MDVRPIRSLTGQVYHYEIFMDGVRVPRDWVLGKPGEGFNQLLKGLDTDRFWGRFYKAPFLRRIVGLLVDYVNAASPATRSRGDDSPRRPSEIAALRALFLRAAWLIERDLPATGPVSAAKVLADELGQRVLSMGMELLGPYGVLRAGSRWARLRGEIEHQYQTSWGHTLAGGTSEIQRTTIAVRALGLPAEPRPADNPMPDRVRCQILMDLSFSPSQQLLQQSARALLQQRCPPERVQGLALDPRGFAADLWKEIATLGWPGLLVPTELGGSGGSVGDALALVEELGRACFPSPFIGSAMVATTILITAGGRRAQALLPALALGERICALAVLEESGRLDPDALALPVAARPPDRAQALRLGRRTWRPT